MNGKKTGIAAMRTTINKTLRLTPKPGPKPATNNAAMTPTKHSERPPNRSANATLIFWKKTCGSEELGTSRNARSWRPSAALVVMKKSVKRSIVRTSVLKLQFVPESMLRCEEKMSERKLWRR